MTSTIKVDTISEKTSANGVAVDGVTLKDGAVGATGTATSVAGIPFFSDTSNGSIYTHDVSGTDSTAEGNVAYGLQALDAVTTGDYNTAIGYQALSAQSEGEGNVAVGQAALLANTTAGNNLAVGKACLLANTTGTRNIGIGNRTNDQADTENDNLAIGYEAMTGAVAGGEYNVAIGNYTLDALTSGDYNVAIGYTAGSDLTSGERNTFIGYEAGKDCIGGGQNVCIGDAAGSGALSTAAGRNIMIGRNSGQAVTSGEANIYVGFEAGKATTIASNNVAVGYQALDAVVVERQCVAIGGYALSSHRTTASSVNDTANTAVGYLAGAGITTGTGNTLLGANCLDTELVSGSNNIAIGSGNTLNNNGNAHSITIGNNIEGNENRFVFGKASNLVENTFTANANFAQSSDQRLKTNITDNDLGLNFINELTTKTYNWKASNDLDKDDPQLVKRYNEENQMNTDVLMYGMLAQDVKAAIIKHNHPNFTGWSEDGRGVQNISREMFVIPLIKAVQELSAQITTLQNEVNTLKGE
jgi:hypothetical protein